MGYIILHISVVSVLTLKYSNRPVRETSVTPALLPLSLDTVNVLKFQLLYSILFGLNFAFYVVVS